MVLNMPAGAIYIPQYVTETSPLLSFATLGPVLLSWLNDQLGVDPDARFSAGGWGDDQIRLVDVTDSL